MAFHDLEPATQTAILVLSFVFASLVILLAGLATCWMCYGRKDRRKRRRGNEEDIENSRDTTLPTSRKEMMCSSSPVKPTATLQTIVSSQPARTHLHATRGRMPEQLQSAQPQYGLQRPQRAMTAPQYARSTNAAPQKSPLSPLHAAYTRDRLKKRLSDLSKISEETLPMPKSTFTSPDEMVEIPLDNTDDIGRKAQKEASVQATDIISPYIPARASWPTRVTSQRPNRNSR